MANAASLSRRSWVTAVAVILAAGAGVAYWAWPAPTVPPKPTPAAADDLVVAPPQNPGYVGSQACAPCHAARHSVFSKTRHHWACSAPDDRPMPAAFEAGAEYQSSEPTIRYTMTKEGGRYVQKMRQQTPGGGRESTTPIDLVYGHGGQFDEVYFTWRDGGLFEMPVTWLHPTKEWANVALSPHQPGDLIRPTTIRCVECHATWLARTPGTANEYDRSTALFGVGCERCHGPGKEHVDFHTAHPAAKAAHAIVDPRKLSRDQSVDLCAQCHSKNAAYPADAPFTYRPGDPLDKSFKTLVSRYPEDDHVANQTKYLKESKCFQKSEMTCVTCHDPHKPVDHRAVADGCGAKCHTPAHCKEQPKLPAAVRDNCTGCHLPARVWQNVHFHTPAEKYLPPIRRYQHRIAVYPEATQEVLLAYEKSRPDGAGKEAATALTTSLVDHWTAEAEKYRKEYRFYSEMRAMREAVHFDPSPAVKGRLQDAINRQSAVDAAYDDGMRLLNEKRPAAVSAFNRLLELKPDAARGHARLGELHLGLGRHDLAETHLRRAAREDPNDPNPFNVLGWTAYQRNQPADAVREFRAALAIDPVNEVLLYRLGLAHLRGGQAPEARAAFEKLYRLNPNHAGGCQGMSHVLRQQGEYAEAVRHARRAALLTDSKNSDVLLSLADAYADAGRRAEAVEAAEKGAAVADTPAVAEQLRRRAAELRTGAYSKIGR